MNNLMFLFPELHFILVHHESDGYKVLGNMVSEQMKNALYTMAHFSLGL